jgi:hypothetical protein
MSSTIMKTLMAAVLLAAVSAAEPPGRLFVRIAPGFEIFVDGVSAGLSSAEEGGKLVKDLAAGKHHILVRSADGREASFDASIVPGGTSNVAISPLGLRKKVTTSSDDETASLRFISIPDDCTVHFRGNTIEKSGAAPLAIDSIASGVYALTASRGSGTLRTDVDLPKGMIVTVQADFASGSIRTIDTRRRPHQLRVTEANDALTSLAIPPQWKTAIRGTLPAGAPIVNASIVEGNGVKVAVRVPTSDVGHSLIRSLAASTAFSKITAADAPRRERVGWVVDFIFYFASGR